MAGSSIKAIETAYDRHRFRSRLEARWAVFFNGIGAFWEYEPEGFVVPGHGGYLPDFLLLNVRLRGGECRGDGGDWKRVFVEVKGSQKQANPREPIHEAFALGSPHPLIVCVGGNVPCDGNIRTGLDDNMNYQYARASDGYVWWDNCMLFCKCYGCGLLKVEFSEGNYMECPECGARCDNEHPAILDATERALSARFEHRT